MAFTRLKQSGLSPHDPQAIISLLHRPDVAMCCVFLILVSFFFIDQPTAYHLHDAAQLGWLHTYVPLLKAITQFGSSERYIIALVLFAVVNFLWLKNNGLQRLIYYFFTAILVSGFLCVMIKIILSRARPHFLFHDHLYGFYFFHAHAQFWSFPSGHSTTMAALMAGLSFLFQRYRPLFVTLIILIGISRILLCEHFVSDVLAGMYLGTITSSYLYQQMILRGKWNAYAK